MTRKFTFAAVLVLFTLCSVGQIKDMIHDELQNTSIDRMHNAARLLHNKNFKKPGYDRNGFLDPKLRVNNFSNLKSYREVIQSLDSLITFDESNEPYQKINFSYNANGDLEQYIYYDWHSNSNAWVEYEKSEYTYDSNRNLTELLYYMWNSNTNSWSIDKEFYSYDSNGNLTQYIYYIWDTSTNSWIAQYKSIFTYDVIGNLIQEQEYKWNTNTISWENWRKYDYTYDSNRIITEIGYYWVNAAWVNNHKRSYSYDANGYMTGEILYNWNPNSNSWTNWYKYDYTIASDGNTVQYIRYTWESNTSAWIISSKYEYTYDSNGNPTTEIYYDSDNSTNQLIAVDKYYYSYDLTYDILSLNLPPRDFFFPEYSNLIINKPLGISFYGWDEETNNWIDVGITEYYYTDLNTNSVKESIGSDIYIYPNPTTDYISFAGVKGNATIELFNLQGKIILSRAFCADEKINVSDLSNGVYFFNLKFDEKIQIGKIIKK